MLRVWGVICVSLSFERAVTVGRVLSSSSSRLSARQCREMKFRDLDALEIPRFDSRKFGDGCDGRKVGWLDVRSGAVEEISLSPLAELMASHFSYLEPLPPPPPAPPRAVARISFVRSCNSDGENLVGRRTARLRLFHCPR